MAEKPTTRITRRFDRFPQPSGDVAGRDPRHQPAEVGPPVDEVQRQREDRVQRDQLDHLPQPGGGQRGPPSAVVVGEEGAEQTEDRARGTRPHHAGRTERVRRGAREDAGREVDQQEAEAAELVLDDGAEQVQRVGVERDVDQPDVQEHAGDEPPVLPGRDAGQESEDRLHLREEGGGAAHVVELAAGGSEQQRVRPPITISTTKTAPIIASRTLVAETAFAFATAILRPGPSETRVRASATQSGHW